MYALAADCSIGSAGSAILMTHSRAAQGEPALIYLKLFPLTGDSDMVSHFMGVQIDLPLSAPEREALLTHCGNSVGLNQSQNLQGGSFQTLSSSSYGQTQLGSSGAPSLSLDCPNTEESRAQGRSHGEMLYQYQQQQYHLHQERISEAQLQQAYFSLSVAPQDTHSSQVGGSFEDLGCSAAHSLCIPDEPNSSVANVPSTSVVSNERSREATSPSSLQQQQLQLLQLQLHQKHQKELQMQQQQHMIQQQQQHHNQQKLFIKEEYIPAPRQERSPSSSSSSTHYGNLSSSNASNGHWNQRQPSCVSIESQGERQADNGISANIPKIASSSSTFKSFEVQQQQQQPLLQQQQQEALDHKGKISMNDITNGKLKVHIEVENGSSNNSNSSCDDEKGLTWYEDLSNTSSV
jgi:hypothetical protein